MSSLSTFCREKAQLHLLYLSTKEDEICVFKIKLRIMPSYLNLLFLY